MKPYINSDNKNIIELKIIKFEVRLKNKEIR